MRKPLFYAKHASGAWDRLDYDVSLEGVVFTRFDGTREISVKALVSSVLDRTKVLRAWCRWLDEEAWGGFGPRTISVGFAVFDKATGNLLEQGESHAPGFDPAPLETDTVEVRVGWDESGRHLDGNMRMIDVKRNPITGLECLWKR